MTFCPITLDRWIADVNPDVSLRLAVFRQVLQTVCEMHAHGVIHYDLKAANLLLQPQTGRNCRQVVVGDFGEARVLASLADAPCQRNRGTEYLKSPEMVTLTAVNRNAKFDRRKPVGTTAASDVWSLGILLFELLTGHQLFSDLDWVAFFTRMADSEPVLGTHECSLLHVGHMHDKVLAFLDFVLVKDAVRRPSAVAVLNQFDQLFRGVPVTIPLPGVPNSGLPVLSDGDSESDSEASLASGTLTESAVYDIPAVSTLRSFVVAKDLLLVLVPPTPNDVEVPSTSRFVIDARRAAQSRTSPLQSVLRVGSVDVETVKAILSFARAAFFAGERVEILDDSDSTEGLGLVAAVVLVRQAERLPNITAAFLRVVSASLLPTTSGCIPSLQRLAKISVVEPQNSRPVCFCGAVCEEWPEDAPEIRRLSEFAGSPAFLSCACDDAEQACPNKGKCGLYADWMAATLQRPCSPSGIRWLLLSERPTSGNTVPVDADSPWPKISAGAGLEGVRLKCQTCGALTHVEISSKSGEFLCTAVCLANAVSQPGGYHEGFPLDSNWFACKYLTSS